MQVSLLTRVVLTAAASAVPFAEASAGGHGGMGPGTIYRPVGGFAGRGGFGAGRFGVFRSLPPVSGVIHERFGERPFVSPYNHTGTAAGFGRGGFAGYGRPSAPPSGGGRPYGASGGYGHVGTGLRYGYGSGRRFGAYGEGRRRLAGRFGFVGGDYGYGGRLYGAPAFDGGFGTYAGQGGYGQGGTYGDYGTTATQSVYGNRDGVPYRSEAPLAARLAEPPLAPSPYAPYSPDDQYAYAASEDVGPGPRILRVHRSVRRDCDCGSRTRPVFYRYGIGTAY